MKPSPSIPTPALGRGSVADRRKPGPGSGVFPAAPPSVGGDNNVPRFASFDGCHQTTELADAFTHRQVLVVVVVRVKVVYLDSQEPVVAGLRQKSHDLAHVDQP